MKTLIASARRSDFRLDWFSGSGAGGQYRNKHQNCVRLTHVPTGITTVGQTERDRPSNLRRAFKVMVDRLVARWIGDERRARWPGSAETVRTYHEPDNRVVDHASGFRQEYSEVVGRGDLARMIESRAAAMVVRNG